MDVTLNTTIQSAEPIYDITEEKTTSVTESMLNKRLAQLQAEMDRINEILGNVTTLKGTLGGGISTPPTPVPPADATPAAPAETPAETPAP